MQSAQHAGRGAKPPGPGGQPSRRTLLGRALLATAAQIGGLAGTLAAAGCGRRTAPAPHPDVGVLVGVIGNEEHLVALYEQARQRHASLAKTVDPALSHHREHLAALRRHYRPGGARGASPSASPSPRRPVPAPRVPGEPDKAVAALRAAERAAAAALGAEVGRVSPGLAQLLASIGACEASHDALLARRA
jgi:hypothetical protein